MSEEEVPWERLPHDPQGFFGLSAGFTRRDLKRAYTRLLRRFKPEQRPEEFKRIRAAFEDLQGALRSGLTWTPSDLALAPGAEGPEPEPSGSDPSSSDPSSSDSSSPGGAPGPSRREALLAAFDAEGLPGLRAALRPGDTSSSLDVLLAALLRDLEAGQHRPEFVAELLREGVDFEAFGFVLEGYLEHPLALEHADETLSLLAERLPAESFYRFAGPLLLRLAEGEFEPFRARLEAWETSLRGLSVHSRPDFDLRLLSRVVFKAEPAWFDARLGTLDVEDLSSEWDYDQLELLVDYRDQRASYGEHPLLDLLGRALQAYVEAPEGEADQEFIACQLKLIDAGAEVLKAFKLGEDYSALYFLLCHVSAEVSGRADLSPEDRSQPFLKGGVGAFLKEAQTQGEDSLLGASWQLLEIGGVLGLIALCFLPPLWAPALGEGFLYGLLPWVVWLPLFYYALVPAVFWGFTELSAQLARRTYLQLWRQLAYERVVSEGVDPHDLEEAIDARSEDANEGLEHATWISNYLPEDTGLGVVWLARRVLA